MSTEWEDYIPDLRIEISDVPTPAAVQAIRKAAIELCREAHVWKEDLDRHHIIGGDPLVDIDVPRDSELQAVTNVSFYPTGSTSSRDLAGPVDSMTLDKLRPGWRDEENTGTTNYPEACMIPSHKVLRLIPTPVVSQSDALGIEATLRPTRDCTEGPDVLYNDYLETIVLGALAYLYAIPGKPWTNLEHAADRRAQFAAAKADAKSRVLRGTGNKPMTVYARTLA